MPFSSFLLGLTLLILVVPFVVEPFLRRDRLGRKPQAAGATAPDLSPTSTPASGIRSPEWAGQAGEAVTKEAALIALRDLDFDFHTGKLAEADYTPLRQQLLAAAAQADETAGAGRGRHPRAVADVGGEPDPIEAAVQARRSQARRGDDRREHGVTDDAIEAAVRRLRRGSSAAVGRVCPECGAPAPAGDRFCHGCGAALDRVCPNCLSPARASDKFCGRCGSSLDEKVVATS